MKKILFALLVMLPMFGQAENYKLVFESTGSDVYSDSIVNIRARSAFDMLYLDLYISNRTDSRIVIEWENVKINGSHIAFYDDSPYDLNRRREDETILTDDGTLRVFGYRTSSAIKIGGRGDTVYLTIPMRVKNGFHDLKLRMKIE